MWKAEEGLCFKCVNKSSVWIQNFPWHGSTTCAPDSEVPGESTSGRLTLIGPLSPQIISFKDDEAMDSEYVAVKPSLGFRFKSVQRTSGQVFERQYTDLCLDRSAYNGQNGQRPGRRALMVVPKT